MKAVGFNMDEVVDVLEQDGQIVIKPIRPDDVALTRLLDGITAENLHEGVDAGEAVGRELL